MKTEGKIASFRRMGFTLTELMIATALASLVAAGGYAAFSYAMRYVLAGGYQVQFNTAARMSSQKIIQYVEQGKAVGVTTNGLNIMTVNLKCARISFDRGDGDLSTVQDNRLIYDPDVEVAGNEKTICRYVSPIEGEQMFSIVASCPNAARVCFHVGDGTNVLDKSFSGTGPGYQGVEVRVSAAPRNIQRWYE